MKKLTIIRHAKSDQRFWGNDFERPLNERGRTDAPAMAKRLREKNPNIKAWISSPAKRAKKTAEIFVQEFNASPNDIMLVTALYHASPEVFYEVVSALPDEFTDVAIFSHNPGITYFINSLMPDFQIDNMPTCGVLSISAEIMKWIEFASSKKNFLFFDYPKRF